MSVPHENVDALLPWGCSGRRPRQSQRLGFRGSEMEEDLEAMRRLFAITDVNAASETWHGEIEWVVAREHPEARTIRGREAVPLRVGARSGQQWPIRPDRRGSVRFSAHPVQYVLVPTHKLDLSAGSRFRGSCGLFGLGSFTAGHAYGPAAKQRPGER